MCAEIYLTIHSVDGKSCLCCKTQAEIFQAIAERFPITPGNSILIGIDERGDYHAEEYFGDKREGEE